MRSGLPILAVGTVLLLAACEQKQGAHVTIQDKDGNVTSSANGRHFALRGNGGAPSGVAVSGNGEHVSVHAGGGKSAVDVEASGNVNVSGKLPGFIAIYPNAKVVSIVTGGNQSGTLGLQANASPPEVIAFYKQKAEAAGFRQNVNAETGGNLLYAASFAGRSVQVLASREGGGTHAQVTWASQ